MIPQLQAWLRTQGLDALLIPRADRYQGEEVLPCDERLACVTGFTGSAGLAVITPDQAALFVDGRYTEQAPQQAPYVSVYNSADTSAVAWVLDQGARRIACDPWLLTQSQAQDWQQKLKPSGAALVALDTNPIDALWQDRPQPALAQAREHPLALTGLSSMDKRRALLADLRAAGIEGHALLVPLPEQVSWLMNVRAEMLAHTPSLLSCVILHPDTAQVDWICEPQVAASAASLNLEACRVSLDLAAALKGLDVPLAYDPASTPWAVQRILAEWDKAARLVTSPVALRQACKTPAELKGMRQAHIKDGVAMAQFLADFEGQDPAHLWDELEAAAHLEQLRRQAGALGLSFGTISATGAHAALPHYRANAQTNAKLDRAQLYLVDSGGQFSDGTTDITRVLIHGTPDTEQKRLYTKVLQGHLALMRQRFPEGTTGQALDAVARLALWDVGLDFDHGTGHGVGACLSVHEGPQRIAKPGSSPAVALKPGMIVSVEPGYYRPGVLGIRIENLVVVHPDPKPGDERSMLAFENLTWCPYARALIDVALLSPVERAQVDAYHAQTYDVLAAKITDEQLLAWLKAATAPLDANP